MRSALYRTDASVTGPCASGYSTGGQTPDQSERDLKGVGVMIIVTSTIKNSRYIFGDLVRVVKIK